MLKLIASIAEFLGPLGKPLANWIESIQKKKVAKMRLEVLELKQKREKIKRELDHAKGEHREKLLEDYHCISSRIMYLQLLLRKED